VNSQILMIMLNAFMILCKCCELRNFCQNFSQKNSIKVLGNYSECCPKEENFEKPENVSTEIIWLFIVAFCLDSGFIRCSLR